MTKQTITDAKKCSQMKKQLQPFDQCNFNPIVTLGSFFTPSKTFEEMTNAEKNAHIAKSNSAKNAAYISKNENPFEATVLGTYPDGRKLVMSGNHLETRSFPIKPRHIK